MSDEAATDRHGLEVIGLDECLTLLASSPYGHLDAGSPRSCQSTTSSTTGRAS